MNTNPDKPLANSNSPKLDEAEALLVQIGGFLTPQGTAAIASEPVETSAHPLEVKLRRAEARYRMLVEQIPAVTFLAELTGEQNQFYVSPQIEALLGFTQKEWMEDPILWYTRLHPEDRERWHIEFAHTCSTGAPFCAEYRFVARNGCIVWVRGEAKFVRDEQGLPLYLQGVAFDITAIKQAEIELRHLNETLAQRVYDRTEALEQTTGQLVQSNTLLQEGEARMRAILDTTVDGIITISSQGVIEGFNRAAERIFGYEAQEVLGKNVSVLMSDPHDAEHDRYLKTYQQTGVKKIIGIGREVEGRRKDGSLFPLDLAVSEVQLEKRRLFTGVVRDITDRKRAEQALHQAKEEAEGASRAKSEFLSRTSHELRTPLNAILGFAQLLEMAEQTPRRHRQLEQIIKGGKHLLNLINEVLDIARIEARELGLSCEPIRIGTLVEEVLDLAQPLAAKEQIRIHIALRGYETRFVFADNQRLKQVLLNLVANGIKYNSPAGSVTVGCESPANGYLRITIRDTGPGIPQDKVKRLFTPFERLGAESTAIEGSGLGLVLSKKLTEAMGGTLGLHSVVGEGSIFHVEFPETQPIAGLADNVAPEVSNALPIEGARTVLFVEDNLANVTLVEDVLSYRPWIRLLTAMQGGLGLEIALLHHPDLIILDVHLPDMKGDAFLHKLKGDPRVADIPVIVLSADATVNQIARLRAAGAQDYLTKPIDVSQLLRTLDQILTAGQAPP